MSFIDNLRLSFFEKVKKQLLAQQPITKDRVELKPVLNIISSFLLDLNPDKTLTFEDVENDLWENWFHYFLHKGIAAAIAGRYSKSVFQLTYDFKEAKEGLIPSYGVTLLPVPGEYSFNLRIHLSDNDWLIMDTFEELANYTKDHLDEIKQEQLSIGELIREFLFFGTVIGVELVNRMELTKEDYWPIRRQLIFSQEADAIAADMTEPDRTGEFVENVIEDKFNYTVHCPFCGKKSLILPKEGDVWNNAELNNCEHNVFCFITDFDNKIVGRDYYKRFFKKAVGEYMEEFKNISVAGNYEGFLNDFYNKKSIAKPNEIGTILKLLDDYLPDCNIIIKEFDARLKRTEKHHLVFHFMRFNATTN